MRLPIPAPRGGHLRVYPGVVATALVVLAFDQATKAWISATLGAAAGPRSIEIVGDWIRFSYTTNTGAAFGMLPSGTLFFTLVALIATPILLFARNYVDGQAGWLTVVFGMLLGGALGNLVDRVRLGYVVDFIDVGIGSVRWWAFNIADSSFVVGIIILALYLSFAPEAAPEPKDDRPYAV